MTLDEHIFEWFNRNFPEEMASCLNAYRDSGSGPEGENSRSEVEGEAPQSGGEANRPTPVPTLPGVPHE